MIPELLIQKMYTAEQVLVLTGAGISAESGLATFRDPGGYWDQYRPEDLANEGAFRRNPRLVQGWYHARRKAALAASPNPGHQALAALAGFFCVFTLVTQNVDRLHQRSGSDRVIELHGNIQQFHCIECGLDAPEAVFAEIASGQVACCRACGGLVRPAVVWFGESLPEEALDAAWQAATRADVVLSVGTSGLVYPAAHLPRVAKRAGAFIAEVNIAPSALASQMDMVLTGKAGDLLPALLDALQNRKKAHKS
ncbi:MAG: NAD-dependent deacylase [Bacteroidetes Order II. Incertae sedis bacterium]|nr:NAD-dependent deacylase [Bacteroidetes Order II. bacterium]